METIIFYILIFCIGSVFGSFFTLAVYRIPLHQDITHERSYCPNCNHKLSFLDMIPILSYIFLGGKCRYCKNKIRIRYLLLEILTGTIFLLFVVSSKISFYSLMTYKAFYLAISFLYLAGIIIIAGIDKEKRQIQKPVLIYTTFIITMYMVYLCIVEGTNIYRYAIYLLLLYAFLIFDNTYKKNNYFIQIIELNLIMLIFCGEKTHIMTIILTIAMCFVKYMQNKLHNNKALLERNNKAFYDNLKLGFYFACSNIISTIIMNFYTM